MSMLREFRGGMVQLPLVLCGVAPRSKLLGRLSRSIYYERTREATSELKRIESNIQCNVKYIKVQFLACLMLVPSALASFSMSVCMCISM